MPNKKNVVVERTKRKHEKIKKSPVNTFILSM